MFTKAFSGLFLAIMTLGFAVWSSPAAACPDTWGWDCFHTGSGSSTVVSGVEYAGSGTISHWYTGTIACDVVTATIDGSITSSSLDVAFTDFDGSNSSSSLCANVTFHNFNWTGSSSGGAPSSETDTTAVDITIRTPVIKYNGTTVCEDEVDITLANDGSGGSTIDIDDTISGWAGSCTLDATLANPNLSFH